MPLRNQSLNKIIYNNKYVKQQFFLRYPADWVIKFHNTYLKRNIPSGRILDFGCGTGNNSVFFMDQGYEVYGADTAEASVPLIKINLQSRGHDGKYINRFRAISENCLSLPFKDNFFDIIVANQVLYYLSSREHIKDLCREFSRCLRPGGIVFFTMMGPKNYYIKNHTKKIHSGGIYEIKISDENHRLYGHSEFIYLVRSRKGLCSLFSQFEPIDIGYFDLSMLDIKSNFHFIFIGKNHKQL